jgi:hypothetical protein
MFIIDWQRSGDFPLQRRLPRGALAVSFIHYPYLLVERGRQQGASTGPKPFPVSTDFDVSHLGNFFPYLIVFIIKTT